MLEFTATCLPQVNMLPFGFHPLRTRRFHRRAIAACSAASVACVRSRPPGLARTVAAPTAATPSAATPAAAAASTAPAISASATPATAPAAAASPAARRRGSVGAHIRARLGGVLLLHPLAPAEAKLGVAELALLALLCKPAPDALARLLGLAVELLDVKLLLAVVARLLPLLAPLGDLRDALLLLLRLLPLPGGLHLLLEALPLALLPPLLRRLDLVRLEVELLLHAQHVVVALHHLRVVVLRAAPLHAGLVEARHRLLGGVQRLVVEGQLALQVVLNLLQLLRRAARDDLRLHPPHLIRPRHLLQLVVETIHVVNRLALAGVRPPKGRFLLVQGGITLLLILARLNGGFLASHRAGSPLSTCVQLSCSHHTARTAAAP
mmetsp:Transcript_31285/g.80243  ORF Transcript_31285/g.80243 Transcript_31285/m.80243 type:complete len:380 (+) Transcript_31285:108-1247(+)